MTPEDKKTFNYLQILKTKIIRANNHEFITKTLQKATMTRFRLKMTIWKIKILQIGITTSINEIFVLIYYEKQNLIISVTLM